MLIVGEKEASENKIAVRQQGKGDIGSFTIEEFKNIINSNIEKNLQPF